MNRFLQCGQTTSCSWGAAAFTSSSLASGSFIARPGTVAATEGVVMVAATGWGWIVLVIVVVAILLGMIGRWRSGARP